MTTLSRIAAALVFVILATVTSASALVKFDFEQKIITDPPMPILDHTVVKKDGLFHLFYLRGNPALTIGHATSADLVRWDKKPQVLSTGTWDNRALWAPHMFQKNGLYYMFFTGVNLDWAQQSGLGFSSDLFTWGKWPAPIYHPDPAWALWDETEFSHGRDPHVLEYEGTYYMFLTAKNLSGLGAIAMATSTDLLNWTDAGPLYTHNSWHVLESVFIRPRDGKWDMFFTEETVPGTSHMVSDELLSGWDIGNRRYVDIGHAPNIIEDGGNDIFSRHYVYNNNYGTLTYAIRFDTLTWNGDIAIVNRPWPLAADWNKVSGNAFDYQPTWGNNPAARGLAVQSTFKGDGWIGSQEQYTGPMGWGSPGFAQGDSRTGVIRSNSFQLSGNSMSLLVGGGNYPTTCYVALVRESDGMVLFSETGLGVDEMDKRTWNIASHKGTTAYIEIADNETGAFGHINVDDIVESNTMVSGGGGNNGGKDRDGLSGVAGVDAPKGTLHANTPNPFNPTTTMSFELAQTADVKLRVYDVNGALVYTAADGQYPAGISRVVWNGRNNTGTQAASGLYFYRLTVNGEIVGTRKMVMLK